MIHTSHLVKQFGSFKAVDEINLEIGRGEIFGFLGANGAGKTTTIRMLSGLLKPSSGEIRIDDLDIVRHSEQIKHKLGYMSQKFSLYPDLKAVENLQFYAGIYRVPFEPALKRLEPLLEQFGLSSILNTLTQDLPMGYKQRLSLVAALMHDPPLVFLDEPTSGVDPQARREFWQVINDLANLGKTIIVSTHFMDEAEYCHRVIIMQDGREVALGNPAELKTKHGSANMQELFLKVLGVSDAKL
ncbi:MAG TPA: ABC transporter ATP-binding protein [Candidatus Cloacimonadota bacterium]|nr:ABC transporter ATP-binding protein [Candidatus Cloacimonadota bacterium]